MIGAVLVPGTLRGWPGRSCDDSVNPTARGRRPPKMTAGVVTRDALAVYRAHELLAGEVVADSGVVQVGMSEDLHRARDMAAPSLLYGAAGYAVVAVSSDRGDGVLDSQSHQTSRSSNLIDHVGVTLLPTGISGTDVGYPGTVIGFRSPTTPRRSTPLFAATTFASAAGSIRSRWTDHRRCGLRTSRRGRRV